jgi:hypothetical protein
MVYKLVAFVQVVHIVQVPLFITIFLYSLSLSPIFPVPNTPLRDK